MIARITERINASYHHFFNKRSVISDFLYNERDYRLIHAYRDVRTKQGLNLIMAVSLTVFGLFIGFLIMWMVAMFWLYKYRTSEEKFLGYWQERYRNLQPSRSDYLWRTTTQHIERSNTIITLLFIGIAFPIVGFLFVIAFFLISGVMTLGVLPAATVYYCYSAVVKLDNLLIEEIRIINPEYPALQQFSSTPAGSRKLSTEAQQLDEREQLEAIFSMSSRIRIDDLAGLLQEPRGMLIKKLLYWGKTYPLRIDGDFLVVEKNLKGSKDLNNLSSSLMSKLPACHACGELLDEDAQYCPSCGEELKNCEICKRSISFGEPVAYCPHCGPQVPFHRGHLLETVKMMKQCPVCRKEITESEVVILEVGKKASH